MELAKLNEYTRLAVDAGIQSYMQRVNPATDKVNQSEAQRFLFYRGFRPAILVRWVREGLLKGHKTGKGKNARVYYSLSEIKNLLLTLKSKEL
jgi:hypothetical protein